MKDRSVLIVGLNYAPEPVGIGPYTQGLAEALAARGAKVRVVCGQPYYPQWRIYAAHAGSGWTAHDENGVKVTRCPHYVPAQPSGLKRIVHLASFALSALLPALVSVLRTRRDKPDLVIAIAPALPSVFTAWLAARLSGAMLWIHVQDFEVEAALATGLLGKGNPLARAAAWVERRLLGLGDVVSTISPQMCAKLVAKGVDPQRVLEVRNWANASFAPDAAGAAAGAGMRDQRHPADRVVHGLRPGAGGDQGAGRKGQAGEDFRECHGLSPTRWNGKAGRPVFATLVAPPRRGLRPPAAAGGSSRPAWPAWPAPCSCRRRGRPARGPAAARTGRRTCP